MRLEYISISSVLSKLAHVAAPMGHIFGVFLRVFGSVGDVLTQFIIKNAKGQDKNHRLYDRGGLYLEVLPAGGKHQQSNADQ